ncbi:glutathione S-transferase family protein [Epibacterium ulvae]|uniref:glutathione binding-like protein n=1 Tax=Epibacterium ulvae TaxID=1156985 RepID=UPI001BFCB980|nr:glutathione S-transferase family protein [Epibacterium ulvae]
MSKSTPPKSAHNNRSKRHCRASGFVLVTESRRLLQVLDTRLAGREWVAGDAMSIADMALYPWARAYPWAKVQVDGLEHLQAWFDRMDARPAVQKALTLPHARPYFWDTDQDESAFHRQNAANFSADVRSAKST